MAYTTFNGISTSDAVSYHAPAADEAPIRVDALLRRAERAVMDLTLTPIPTTTDYQERAADAELAAFEFLWEHRAYFQNEALDRSVVRYSPAAALNSLIREALGLYARHPLSLRSLPR